MRRPHRKSRTVVGQELVRDQPEDENLIQQAINQAYKTPYLMDELIAFAAAHKSVVPGQPKSLYASEATRLQTRALAAFNAATAEISDENCMSMFWFSAILGQHVMFNTFSSLSDLSTVLDRFVQCLTLHRGVRVISSEAWPRIQQELYGHVGDLPLDPAEIETGSRGDECASLFQLLDESGLNRSCIKQDVLTLQRMFDEQNSREFSKSRYILLPQEWLVRVSVEFVHLVEQRRPEALVVLAHYSVLLLRAKHYWVIDGAGGFLIQSITRHLGSYWSPWLKWPNLMLEDPSLQHGGPR
ncbi:hypothetical protein TruAng_006611 [Truncatella angustata]|nr:hypothetical protein TruAng_006611 [Truncatella angustata]